jgi:predicted DNA-binding transcriptional regulator YafY
MSRTDRLYALVEELRAVSPGYRTASWLAERFEVSVRTVERDLSALQSSGVPIYATPGRRGGYAIDASHTLPPVNLTAAEATTIAVALSNPGATPFTAAGRSALLKIMAVMASDDAAAARDLAERVRLYEPKPEEPSEPDHAARGEVGAAGGARGARGTGARRDVLEQAIVERRVTRLAYVDRLGTLTERVVEPVAVVGLVPDGYLVAWCRLREDIRYFRLDRVLDAELTDEVAVERREVEIGPPGYVGRSPAFD